MQREDHRRVAVMEAELILAGIFFAVVVVAALEYYKYIVKIKDEYEKAKELFNEVIISFSRDLKRTIEKLENISYKVDVASSRSSEVLKMAESLENRVDALDNRVAIAPEDLEKINARLEEVERKTREALASQEVLTSKISNLEEQTQKLSLAQEISVEEVIPIKKEKALAPLTETELAVLEMLAKEGPKTAPEIKERIKLSREHTARLMKKLYEGGYLERDSSKIPFKYSVKKEMGKILDKTEVGSS